MDPIIAIKNKLIITVNKDTMNANLKLSRFKEAKKRKNDKKKFCNKKPRKNRGYFENQRESSKTQKCHGKQTRVTRAPCMGRQ